MMRLIDIKDGGRDRENIVEWIELVQVRGISTKIYTFSATSQHSFLNLSFKKKWKDTRKWLKRCAIFAFTERTSV
jgi:hypothetical protein